MVTKHDASRSRWFVKAWQIRDANRIKEAVGADYIRPVPNLRRERFDAIFFLLAWGLRSRLRQAMRSKLIHTHWTEVLVKRRGASTIEVVSTATKYEGWFYAMKNMIAKVSTTIWSISQLREFYVTIILNIWNRPRMP
jgi:hypothetical protein